MKSGLRAFTATAGHWQEALSTVPCDTERLQPSEQSAKRCVVSAGCCLSESEILSLQAHHCTPPKNIFFKYPYSCPPLSFSTCLSSVVLSQFSQELFQFVESVLMIFLCSDIHGIFYTKTNWQARNRLRKFAEGPAGQQNLWPCTIELPARHVVKCGPALLLVKQQIMQCLRNNIELEEIRHKLPHKYILSP